MRETGGKKKRFAVFIERKNSSETIHAEKCSVQFRPRRNTGKIMRDIASGLVPFNGSKPLDLQLG